MDFIVRLIGLSLHSAAVPYGSHLVGIVKGSIKYKKDCPLAVARRDNERVGYWHAAVGEPSIKRARCVNLEGKMLIAVDIYLVH
jgi:hypothetical protein